MSVPVSRSSLSWSPIPTWEGDAVAKEATTSGCSEKRAVHISGKRYSLLGRLSQSAWSGTANSLLPLDPEGRRQKLKAEWGGVREKPALCDGERQGPWPLGGSLWVHAWSRVTRTPDTNSNTSYFAPVAYHFHSRVLTNLSLIPPCRKHLMLSFSDITMGHIWPTAVTLHVSIWLVISCFYLILYFSW